MSTPPPPGLTDHELALWRGLDATVDRFDRYLSSALERLADRLDVDIDTVPAGTLVDAALAIARASGKPGPSAYLGLPIRDWLIEHGIDSYPADLIGRVGPAGPRCWTDTSSDGLVRSWDAGIDFLCLLPIGHGGRHGFHDVRVVCDDADTMGGAAENFDTGAGEALLDALSRDPGHTRRTTRRWAAQVARDGWFEPTADLIKLARRLNA